MLMHSHMHARYGMFVKDKLQESALVFVHVGLRDLTNVMKPGSKSPDLLASP